MSHVTRKPVFEVSDQVRHNQQAQLQKVARGVNMTTTEIEGRQNTKKGLISLTGSTDGQHLCFWQETGFLMMRLILHPRNAT